MTYSFLPLKYILSKLPYFREENLTSDRITLKLLQMISILTRTRYEITIQSKNNFKKKLTDILNIDIKFTQCFYE